MGRALVRNGDCRSLWAAGHAPANSRKAEDASEAHLCPSVGNGLPAMMTEESNDAESIGRNIYELCIDHIIAYATQCLSHPLSGGARFAQRRVAAPSAFMIIRSMRSRFSLFTKKTSIGHRFAT